MLVIPHHLIDPDDQPPTLSYRIGRRTISKPGKHRRALKSPSPSGTNSVGTPTNSTPQHRVKHEAATACRAQRLKFLPWTDTSWTNLRTCIIHRGDNNRTLIASTAAATTDPAQTPPGPSHSMLACTACQRLADTTIYLDCGQWHHMSCIPHCRVIPDHSTPTYGLHTLHLRAARTHSIGDGIVTHQEMALPSLDPSKYMLPTSQPRRSTGTPDDSLYYHPPLILPLATPTSIPATATSSGPRDTKPPVA
ncbi:hypothetical protein H257_01785 [Aphanomyces astaci]|uniref:Uncharacterized protein n=1 Tax=Aphanomyces astaci TaxID=112090 RepID=W4H3T9_APHAT|nr:hypothetical protein H257_01785 [Aphanomyces astaci]ETV86660.1 hypothetical protein H257_01785 [Aphanomyces astaci]|eukprot:XP_009823459.1 hypothetical protein H257_01785 [Aphanomyces astaci]